MAGLTGVVSAGVCALLASADEAVAVPLVVKPAELTV